MTKKIGRRSFIKNSTLFGASALFTSPLAARMGFTGKKEKSTAFADISVVKGEDYFKSTLRAVDMIGGIRRFVPRGSRVALLPNAQRNNPGVYTKPEIVRAVVRMCREAGAKEVNCLSWLPLQNWESTEMKKAIEEEKGKLILVNNKDESLFKPVKIPGGEVLKEARIMTEFFRHDVFIDMPITKDHAGNKFTGTLKNLMGLSSPRTNRTFHKKDWSTNIDSIKFLDQCIADLNTIITPDLCVVDATELITTNGPFGPGKIVKPKKVVAGVDRVGIDSYCCTLWGLKPADIFTIVFAHRHGLGQMDTSQMKIREVAI